MKKCCILNLILVFIVFSRSYSHKEHVGIGLVLSVSNAYTFHDKNLQVGSSIHGIFAMVNGSLEQSSLVAGNDNRLKAYLGVGLGPVVQLQWSFHGSFRLRSDLVIGGDNPPAFSYWDDKWGIFRSGVVLSPIIEYGFDEGRIIKVGIGIGLYF